MTTLSALQISEHVYWVGAIDWNIRDFHGYETSRGTTYNAYLILGDKPVLIDTVKATFFDEMMARIQSVIDPQKITAIISNHAEMDHSGSLPKAIEAIQPDHIYASVMGVQALKDNLHLNAELTSVKTGEKLSLGNAHFSFIETRMLHWPDSMFTYFENDQVLFSQDGLGMHLATDQLFADQHDTALLRQEAAKYYANILMPYSPLVSKLLDALPRLKLDIKMIAPDHGPIWNTAENINWIISRWKEWAQQKPIQKVVIVYDTMWKSTQKMATAINDGIMTENINCSVMPLSSCHRSDIATELLEAGALIVGSPVLNKEIFPTVVDCLTYLKGLNRTNLIGQVFGSYGWADTVTPKLKEYFKQMNIELVGETVTSKYVPTDDVLVKCRTLGQQMARRLSSQSQNLG